MYSSEELPKRLLLRTYPDPILRTTAKEVQEFDKTLMALSQFMIQKMNEWEGVGLAANQIGILERVIVFRERGVGAANVLVNPVIVLTSSVNATIEEHCLSLPGVVRLVTRPNLITVRGHNELGDKTIMELDSITSRIVQHEIDHLDGLLIIDRN